MRGFLLAVVLFGAMLGAGCGETPTQGFEAFYDALADGSPNAYARLSTSAQAAFTGAARARGLDPQKYLTSSVPKASVRRIDVVEENGETAVLAVTDALGNVARVEMLREGRRWRVDLSP